MKLYYYKDPHGNFGDDLNPWLWSRLYPEIIDGDDDELFIGIGTLLNHRLPKRVRKHVFGSGYGYGDKPHLNDSFQFHAVRGPMTAEALGLDRSLVITDPAVLIRAVAVPMYGGGRYKTGFIPHAHSNALFDWSLVCQEIDIHFIDARWSVDRVLQEIQKCELLLCEAMHGAIVADALRVPWIPVKCYKYIDDFKWRDWLGSIGLTYNPYHIESLFDSERYSDWRTKLKNRIKRNLRQAGIWRTGWSPPPRPRTGASEYNRAVHDLSLTAQCEPTLSKESLIDAMTNQYLERLADMRRLIP